MVLSSQCIMQPKPKKMRINVTGKLGKGITPKDVTLYIISKLTAAGATGYFVEYAGEVFENMSMEGRMTVCNMSIEMGARGGMIAPDETTFAYIKGKDKAPKGEAWEKALAYWKTLKTDEGAHFDMEYHYDAADIEPMITYGTNPGMGMGITKHIPVAEGGSGKASYEKSLNYMGFHQDDEMLGKKVDYVFIGSCTKKAEHVTAWIVPGSHIVEQQIREEGILDILTEAGFQLRQPGCSACLAMNDDKVPAGKYAVSTSNRNFEGRQGPGARTMLASPLVAAAAAVTGVVTDPRELL
jgi:3-isopropylmalate/(R)-2-methylmalate dehydratase large subunit